MISRRNRAKRMLSRPKRSSNGRLPGDFREHSHSFIYTACVIDDVIVGNKGGVELLGSGRAYLGKGITNHDNYKHTFHSIPSNTQKNPHQQTLKIDLLQHTLSEISPLYPCNLSAKCKIEQQKKPAIVANAHGKEKFTFYPYRL